jgi:hypothetical protein
MKRASLGFFAVFSLLVGGLMALTPACLADESVSCSSSCSSSDCGGSCCCCCSICKAICNFRLVDDCTLCAWHRTWYGPNALATPIRMYYIPRPPECSECDGYKYGLVLESVPAERVVMSSEVSPAAAAGFWPAEYERLGHIRNELDVPGAAGSTNRAGSSPR